MIPEEYIYYSWTDRNTVVYSFVQSIKNPMYVSIHPASQPSHGQTSGESANNDYLFVIIGSLLCLTRL